MNQELQLPHLTGINLFKKQCNFQEFCLKSVAIAYSELRNPFCRTNTTSVV